MKQVYTLPSAPKTVSADTKTSNKEVYHNYSLPVEPTSLDVLRKALELRENAETNEIFENLILDKVVCPRPMLKEMFGINNDYYLRRVFREGRQKCDRRYYDDFFARQVVRLTMDRDNKPLQFTPAQEKLRALLAKRLDWSAYANLMNELDDEYSLDFEDFYYGASAELEESCNISEEELLDALQTYQNEHHNR